MGAGNQTEPAAETLKFLCSYGGKILLRHTDGEFRYVGGHTRVLSIHPSVSFSELTAKITEFCGQPVALRCQLPDGDLETLITIKSEEDLANLIEEYDRVSSPRSYKIRAILSPPPKQQVSPAQSTVTTDGSGECSPSRSLYSDFDSPPNQFYSPTSAAVGGYQRGKVCYYPCHVQRTHHHHHHHQFPVPHCN